MGITNHFATSIYYESLSKKSSKKFNEDLLDEAYKLRAMDKAGQKWCAKNYPGGYTSYHSYSELHRMSSTFEKLEKEIKKHVLKFSHHLDYDLSGKTLSMTDCWVNIMPERVIHPMHLHPVSTISGTYYVQTPKGCSNIIFEDPRLGFFMGQPPRVSKPKTQNKYYTKVAPEAGKVVLFESWLRHQVDANPTKEDRVSVSFNYHWM